MPGDLSELPASVSDSVLIALGNMPQSVYSSPTALAAIELARSIDMGTETYRFQSALVAQLRDCMADLEKAASAAEDRGDDVDDLSARRSARRAAAQAAQSSSAV